VPPAWLINRSGICAVREAGFDYLGLYRGWMRLSDEKKIPAPTITYSTRHPWGDALCRGLQGLIAAYQHHSPVLRLALHPADLQRPENLEHARRLISHCLRVRKACTEHQAYLQSLHPCQLVP
jgi:predicted deacetylase